jgi:hypothetical protein
MKGNNEEAGLPWRKKREVEAAAHGIGVGRWVLGVEQGGLLDKSAQVSKVDEQVLEGDIGDGSGQAIGPDPLQAEAGSLAVACLGGVSAGAIVLLPEIRAAGVETSQADVVRAVGVKEGTAHMPDLTPGAVGVAERTGLILEVGLGATGADLAADPAGPQALIVDAIEGHGIAMSTKQVAVLVIAGDSGSQDLHPLSRRRSSGS